MRCVGYCTAASYDLMRLFPFLQVVGYAELHRDVVYARPKEENGVIKAAFYFSYGAVLFWGFEPEEERAALLPLKKFEREGLAKPEVDEFRFSYGERIKIADDKIVLHKKDMMIKLAVSYAIGQSVKLTVFEEAIARTIEHSKQIPKDLVDQGKIPLSRKEIARKMGELFLERNYINLHTEILDTPEFFWEQAELEPYYRRMIHYLDVTKRVDLLNRRLNLLHELLEILSDQLNQQYTARLEWTIIILIVIEVILALSRDLFHII